MNFSPLRYPGGKAKISPVMEDIIITNRLRGSVFIEPFCGGAGVGLSMLFSGLIDRLVLNDADFGVASFWETVLKDHGFLVDRVKEIQVTIDEWRKQKQILKTSSDRREMAFATLFLNRCNRSGILNGGCIGGIRQQKYKIDARFNREIIISKIKKVNSLRDKIEIHNMDVFEFLNKINNFGKVLVYLDPPYWEQGKTLYREYFVREQHEKLASAISDLNVPFVLSYDNVDSIKEMYDFARIENIAISYSAADKRRESEAFILSNDLRFSELPKENEKPRTEYLSLFSFL